MRRKRESASQQRETWDATDALLRVEQLKRWFPVRGGTLRRIVGHVRAVDGVSFAIRPGESTCLVGESGCGKTTTAKLILLLEKPTEGVIYFEGRDIHRFSEEDLRRYRGSIHAVFQDPWSSLSPRMRAESIISEPLEVNQRLSRKEIRERVEQLLRAVGLQPAHANLYPHEFSGGMRQRLAIARALSLNPRLVVLDEPVSSLDVSIQAQVMNLLKNLQSQYGMSYLLIAHNLGVVRYLSHRLDVMYLGKIVEEAPSEEVFAHPLHPYTQALISAALPTRPGQQREDIILGGEVPSPMRPPPGCRFHPRCPSVMDCCSKEEPQLREVAPGHRVACHLY